MPNLTRRLLLAAAATPLLALPAHAQAPDPEEGVIPPEVEVIDGDYAQARRRFRTRLTQHRPAPGRITTIETTPAGVTRIAYGPRRLAAWTARPSGARGKSPAVLFLHGGFAFAHEDWEMARPFLDAGFTVMAPLLRGENGQPGDYSLFYDEVDDVLAAARHLKRLPHVDPRRVFVAGHSVGGTLVMLASMADRGFRGAASFSGSPDQVIFCRHGIRTADIPFDVEDRRELQMRSPMSYAASFKAPARLYFGTGEPHFRLSSERTVKVARAAGLDVALKRVEGSHDSAVPAAMADAIVFFNRLDAGRRAG